MICPTAVPVSSQPRFARSGRHSLPDLANRGCEDTGTAVGQIITVDGGYHHVLQAHALHGLRHSARLQQIQDPGFTAGYSTKAAGTRADVAEDHKRSGAVLPALAHVRAARFLT